MLHWGRTDPQLLPEPSPPPTRGQQQLCAGLSVGEQEALAACTATHLLWDELAEVCAAPEHLVLQPEELGTTNKH